MTEDEIKALCKIRDKYCQWGEVAVMDKAIRFILDQMQFNVDDNSMLGKMVADLFH